MSIDKTLSQADKLLEKGKVEEAIEKYKEALRSDPNHQQANTKLASAYVSAEQPEEAVKIFEKIAAKASEAGRTQVAVAFLKQANELLPDHIGILTKLAIECENIGKMSESSQFAQRVLGYFVTRKKYIEALPMCALLVRVLPKDEKFKLTWIELLTYVSIEEKILPALVYFTGPPGFSDKEFAVGGDPSALSEIVYQKLVKLLHWYPKSAKLAYALGWAAYKRNNLQAAYNCIREGFRRDPDCSLNVLLYARILSDQKKLNECYYIYKYAKEKIAVDKTIDTLSLNQQFVSFEEKNGWIAFNEGLGETEQLTPNKFLDLFIKKVASSNGELNSSEAKSNEKNITSHESQLEISIGEPEKQKTSQDPAAEINLSPPTISVQGDAEIILSSGDTKKIDEVSVPVPVPVPVPMSVPEPAVPTTAAALVEEKPFNPLENLFSTGDKSPERSPEQNILAATAEVPTEAEEKTEMLSPMEVLKAAGWKKDPSVQSTPSPEPAENIFSEDDATKITSLPPEKKKEDSATDLSKEQFDDLGIDRADPTKILVVPSSAPSVVAAPADIQNNQSSVQAVPAPQSTDPMQSLLDSFEDPEPELVEPASLLPEAAKPAVLFVPIPEQAVKVEKEIEKSHELAPPAEDQLSEKIDRGSDLLEAPTKMLPSTSLSEGKTEQLITELKKEEITFETLLRKGERFFAKRNYYLARKSYRQALLLGADQEYVKNKLREIRLLEMPDGMYAKISNDTQPSTNVDDLLETLELDFDVEETVSKKEISQLFNRTKFKKMLTTLDARSCIDLGIAFFEMGLFSDAENLLLHSIHLDQLVAFEANYLIAECLVAKKEYAGAVNLLKQLVIDKEKQEDEKLPIYFLLGEAFEKMNQSSRSKKYYSKAAKINASYRNVSEKLERE